jgi:NADPH2:quinone reductase
VPVIVNYRTENVALRVLEATDKRGVDRISEVDFGGNLSTTLAVMRQSCVIGTYASRGVERPSLAFYQLLFANVTVRFIQCSLILGALREDGIRDLTRWAEADRLIHPTPKILPLERIAEAHELVEKSSPIGKVMVSL